MNKQTVPIWNPRAKQWILLLLVVILCVGLCGCSVLPDFLNAADDEEKTPTLPPDRETQIPVPETSVPTETSVPKETTEVPLPETSTGTVTADFVNLRGGPGTDFSVVGSLNRGDVVTVREAALSENLPWGKTDSGWVCLNYVKLDSPDILLACAEKCEKPTPGVVNTAILNIRTGPGTHYDVVTTVDLGYALQVTHQLTVNEEAWGRTERGWVAMEYVIMEGNRSIIGSWYHIAQAADGSPEFVITVLEFLADGTFREQRAYDCPSHGVLETETPDHRFGTYTFNGAELTRDESTYLSPQDHTPTSLGTAVYPAAIDGNKLDLVSGGDHTVYTRGSVEDAKKEIIRTCYDKRILGKWYCLERTDTGVCIREHIFRNDTSFECTTYFYDPDSGKLSTYDTPEKGWFYYSDNTLHMGLTILHCTIENDEMQLPCSGSGRIHQRGDVNEAVAAIVRQKQEQNDAAEKNDPAILGTWYCIRGWSPDQEPGYMEPPYKIEVVTFHENGTVECQTYKLEEGAEAPVRDSESPWLPGGTYSYDYLDRGMMEEYDVTIENGVLHVGCAGAMEFYHRGGVDEAVNTIHRKTAAEGQS